MVLVIALNYVLALYPALVYPLLSLFLTVLTLGLLYGKFCCPITPDEGVNHSEI